MLFNEEWQKFQGLDVAALAALEQEKLREYRRLDREMTPIWRACNTTLDDLFGARAVRILKSGLLNRLTWEYRIGHTILFGEPWGESGHQPFQRIARLSAEPTPELVEEFRNFSIVKGDPDDPDSEDAERELTFSGVQIEPGVTFTFDPQYRKAERATLHFEPFDLMPEFVRRHGLRVETPDMDLVISQLRDAVREANRRYELCLAAVAFQQPPSA
jgi:hypothetical protein